MPTYNVSSTYFFRRTGEKVEAGGTIELSELEAESINDSHPGLLKLARQTAQAHADTVREPVEIEHGITVKKPRGRKPRATR